MPSHIKDAYDEMLFLSACQRVSLELKLCAELSDMWAIRKQCQFLSMVSPSWNIEATTQPVLRCCTATK
jgi:hypothetical protein